MTTPLPSIDVEHVCAFWERFLAAGLVTGSPPVPDVVEPFGANVEQADELIALILDGSKRATASALAAYEHEASPIPRAGVVQIATDGSGRARAVLRTTEVRVGPLCSVDETFAWDEGEGDRTRVSWLAEHERWFGAYLPTIGLEFDPDMSTVFERFEVLFTVDDAGRGAP